MSLIRERPIDVNENLNPKQRRTLNPCPGYQRHDALCLLLTSHVRRAKPFYRNLKFATKFEQNFECLDNIIYYNVTFEYRSKFKKIWAIIPDQGLKWEQFPVFFSSSQPISGSHFLTRTKPNRSHHGKHSTRLGTVFGTATEISSIFRVYRKYI